MIKITRQEKKNQGNDRWRRFLFLYTHIYKRIVSLRDSSRPPGVVDRPVPSILIAHAGTIQKKK